MSGQVLCTVFIEEGDVLVPISVEVESSSKGSVLSFLPSAIWKSPGNKLAKIALGHLFRELQRAGLTERDQIFRARDRKGLACGFYIQLKAPTNAPVTE